MINKITRVFREGRYKTLKDSFDRYLKEITPTKKSADQNERSIVNQWSKTHIYNKKLNRITSRDISTIRDDWLSIYKPSTVLRRISLLSHLYTVAIKDWGYLSLSNPVNQTRKPKVSDSRSRRIQRIDEHTDELDLIVGSIKSYQVKSIVLIAIETAMRRSEIVFMLWADICFESRTAFIRDTKNGDDRIVPLSKRAIAILSNLPRSGDRVFSIRPETVSKTFSRDIKRTRLEYKGAYDSRLFVDLRFHDLRHEAISRMASKFKSHELAKITGHKDTRMLMRYYHPDMSKLAKRL